jgi:hypothetical protein
MYSTVSLNWSCVLLRVSVCVCVCQVYAGKSAGFDPEETRFYRKGSAAAAAAAAAAGDGGKMKLAADFQVPYVPSESGCG